MSSGFVRKPETPPGLYADAPVLIVEDRRENQVLLQRLCKDIGLESVVVANGQEALEQAQADAFSLYIVDLMLPVMDGPSFIRELKRLHPQAIVLVETAVDTPERIIDVMKLGVFDYLVKPLDEDRFRFSMHRALEMHRLRRMHRHFFGSDEQKLRGQLEWLSYKEMRRQVGADSVDRNAIHNLKNVLAQGGGIGASVSLIDMLRATAREDEAGLRLDSEVTELLFDNNEQTRLVLQGLETIEEITHRSMNLAPCSAREFLAAIPEQSRRVEEYARSRRIRINYPELRDDVTLALDRDYMLLMIEEMLLNAAKYSAADSEIDVFAGYGNKRFRLSVNNELGERSSYGGITGEYRTLVLEPFFRMGPPITGVGQLERFGLGLGLAVVNHVCRAHGGIFQIQDVLDHTRERLRKCVLAEINLPLNISEASGTSGDAGAGNAR